MTRLFLFLGSTLAGLAVVGGAFAAHFLKFVLSETLITLFQTGIRYQMYHALALILVSILLHLHKERIPLLIASGAAFLVGILFFSGSLYLLCWVGYPLLGMVTPIGGISFILGWICLAIAAWTDPNPQPSRN